MEPTVDTTPDALDLPPAADMPAEAPVATLQAVATTVPSGASSAAEHEVMGAVLTRTIAEGKQSMPEHPAPLVCKPREVESWRVFKIMSEFVEGFDIISKYGLAATFFGSSRATFEDHFYAEATELAGRLAKQGYAIITGAAAGIMEAANKGAYEAGGASIGLNIRLDSKQGDNKYLTEHMTFDHFFVRKVMLAYASEVYIYFPGGYGTLDEFTELLTLVQTKNIKRVPIVLYGAEYWNPLIAFFKTKLYGEHRAVDEEDLELFQVVDTVDEAYTYIMNNVQCK